MNQNVTSKEISPGIILLKYIHPSTKPNQDLTYVFKVQLNRLNILEFLADFTGSENIILDGANSNIMSTITLVQPFETQQVAKLTMKYDWKLKTKFRFTLKPTTKEVQYKYIADDALQLTNDLQKAQQLLSKYPIDVKEISDIIKLMNNTPFIDTEFPPTDTSIFGISADHSIMDTLIQWRRPAQFFQQKDANKRPEIFFDKIEPNDIKQGALGNCWLLSALSSLAERPALVRRLFVTTTVNQTGVYRVKICKNGEWVYVTVDDLFPCYPMGTPIFSAAHGNELWVLLLEKAYAKLHGCYFALRYGHSGEAMIDLAGCPTEQLNFDEAKLKQITQGLWTKLKQYDEDGYLINAYTEGNDKWSEGQRPDGNDTIGLVPGHAYAVLTIKEVKGVQLLNLRNPWGNFEWKGDWSDTSNLWTQEMKNEVNFVNDQNDGQFWMGFKDFLQHFRGVNICKVRNWDEVRIKGKFIKVNDVDDGNIEVVMSKWYYTLNITQPTKIIIGVHQEDERCLGVELLRSYMDIGIVVLRRNENGNVELVDQKQCKFERQMELECDLKSGNYIILPRTSGLTLRRPLNAVTQQIQMLINNQLHPLVESTINDIFRKYDMLLTRELSYIEFKGFYETLEKSLDAQFFKTQILQKYASSDKGITLKGFQDYFRDQIQQLGDSTMWKWFDKLGYDKDLYSIRSRTFLITIHSSVEIAVTVRDAISTDLDNRGHILATITQNEFTQMELLRFENDGVRAIQSYNRLADTFTIIAINDQTYPIEISIDCNNCAGLIFSIKNPFIRKRLEPGQMEFMMHFKPVGNQKVKLHPKCHWVPI